MREQLYSTSSTKWALLSLTWCAVVTNTVSAEEAAMAKRLYVDTARFPERKRKGPSFKEINKSFHTITEVKQSLGSPRYSCGQQKNKERGVKVVFREKNPLDIYVLFRYYAICKKEQV